MNNLTISERKQLHPRKRRWSETMSLQQKDTLDFIRTISLPQTHIILEILSVSPTRFTSLRDAIQDSTNSKTAYYIKKLEKSGCITQSQKDKLYSLTFKGVKVFELYKSILELQSMTIENYDPEKTTQYIKIQSSRTWLEPYLEHKITEIINKNQLRIKVKTQ